MSSKIIANRVASAVRASAVKPFAPRALVNSASRNRYVSVTSYTDGQRMEQELPKAERPVPQETAKDVDRVAQPFSQDVAAKLNPTLRNFTLEGKVALVTGAGRGLGLNMAQALAEAGARGIAIFDVDSATGDKAAAQLAEQTGIDVRFYKVDVRDADSVHNSVADAAKHFGQIDILVNSAGIADSNQKAEKYEIERFRRQIDINVTGTFVVAQACAEHMIASKKGGSMIFIASMSGSIVNYPQEQSCYNASKAAVVHLTKSLATEWARYNIRVNAISPGYMDTALNRVPALEAQKKIWIDNTPQKRLGNVDELNGLCVFLAGPSSTFMTGSQVVIDGGFVCW